MNPEVEFNKLIATPIEVIIATSDELPDVKSEEKVISSHNQSREKMRSHSSREHLSPDFGRE
jgi:hypothetical protein